MENNFNPITVFILFVAFCVLLLKQCDNAHENDSKIESYHIETYDTIFVPGDTIYRDTIIYLPVEASRKEASEEQVASNACDSIRAYMDSLYIDSTSMVYYYDTILGKKLTYRLTFSGKPYTRQITNTITDSIPYPVRSFQSGLYAIADAGGSLTQFNYSIGADYISKKKWSAGYRYGINQKTHNIKIGYKLF